MTARSVGSLVISTVAAASRVPVVLALIFSVVAPGHINTMFTDPLGIKMLAVGATMQLIGSLIIRKLVNIRY